MAHTDSPALMYAPVSAKYTCSVWVSAVRCLGGVCAGLHVSPVKSVFSNNGRTGLIPLLQRRLGHPHQPQASL